MAIEVEHNTLTGTDLHVPWYEGASAPSSPVEGTYWGKTDEDPIKVYRYTSAVWVEVACSAERVQDLIGAAVAGSGLASAAYDDGTGVTTITVSNESVQDMLGTFIVGAGMVDVTYDDATNTMTISASNDTIVAALLDIFIFTGGLAGVDNGDGTLTLSLAALDHTNISDFDEAVQDTIGAAIAAGAQTGMTVTYNDVPGTFDFATDDVYLAEMIRDMLATSLVAGTNITITINDIANTITIDSTGGGGGAGTVIVQQNDADVDTAAATLDFDGSFVVSSSPAGEVNIGLDYGTGAGQVAEGDHAHTITSTINVVIDGGGSAPAVGTKIRFRVGFAGTWVKNSLGADVSGSCVLDIWKDVHANYPPTVADTITASAKPTLSSATHSEDGTLTGWTTSFSAGDWFVVNVDSASTLTVITLALDYTRTV